MNKLLTLKHWQLFLLLFVPIILLQIVLTAITVLSSDPMLMLFVFPVAMILFAGVYFGWFYVLGTNLPKKLPHSLHMNVVRFRTLLFFPLGYLVLISAFIALFPVISPDAELSGAVFLILVPLHFFAMFCIFYSLYFIAKALKMVELRRPVSFSDFVGEFFMLWFLPVGIWIIQPRINKLFAPGPDGTGLAEDSPGSIF